MFRLLSKTVTNSRQATALSRTFSTISESSGDVPKTTPSLPTLNHYVSKHGIASRRGAADLILKGRVRVNGRIVNEAGYRVAEKDTVEVNGKLLGSPGAPSEPPRIVLMMNKPHGYECTRPTRHTEPGQTIYDLIDEKGLRFLSVGRLDKNSEGLLLLTTDGTLANDIIHPSRAVEKEYLVRTRAPLSTEDMAAMTSGLEDEGEILRAARVTAIPHPQFNYSIVLTSGRKREARRLVRARGNHVYHLRRVRVGGLQLGELPLGKTRVVKPEELELIWNSPKID